MRVGLICWSTYGIIFIVMSVLPMLTEWNNPILVDIKYNGSYWLYFWGFVFPFLFKFAVGNAVAVGLCHWVIVRDIKKNQVNQQKYDAIKDHFGIDYDKDD